jgi:hypothetical protein
MPILDRLNLFSNDQVITGSANSADLIDLSSLRDVGDGMPVEILILVTQTFDNLTSLTATMETSSTEAFSVAVPLIASTLPLASLTAGTRFPIGHLPGGALRFLRVAYTVVGSNPTTGKVVAGIGAGGVHQDTAIYPDSL